MGFFDSIGSGLSNLGSSVGNWLSVPDNRDKLAAWGQELSYLGNPASKTDPGSIYLNYMKHKAQPMGNASVVPDATAAATTPADQTPAAPAPLQISPLQLSPNGVYQPYGQSLPQNTSPYRLTIPTIKLGGY
jgi:hypothetical protein